MRNYRDLAHLASLSAMVIDSYINNWRIKKKEYFYVKELIKELDRLSKERLDLGGLVMLAEVIWPNNEDLKRKEKDDVYLQTNLLAKNLARFREFSKEKQEELKDVCVDLSRRLMYPAYRLYVAV